MIENSLLQEEKLLRRHAPLPPVREGLRQEVVIAARQALVERRWRRQKLLAVAAAICIACLSIWRISEQSRAGRNLGSVPQKPGVPRSPAGTAPSEIIPGQIVPQGAAVENSPAVPGRLFQGPILGLMGGGDPRAVEEQLRNRQQTLRQFFESL